MTRKQPPVNTTAKGRYVIPIENYALLEKAIKRLTKDGIPFEMEDADEVSWTAMVVTPSKVEWVPQGPCSATIITFGQGGSDAS